MNLDVRRDLEMRSSAMTLSDMELFIFPELIYSLLLANIMSPRIWQWRADPWFKGLSRMSPYRRIQRLKQFIMDHYLFNLDLDTWGLTTKERELARFAGFIDEQTLARSNALFGYEGDKYYFDIDIRTHFGLDKYTSDTIPYWKTETVEAMDAFVHRENYRSGAGECVSLATLYAAALFVVAGVPLRDIFLMATPLHSQNFVDVDDGILTNNRRLVTRTMWSNGSALSAQARRALENEQVTIVAHETGVIHVVYPEATIEPAAYERFTRKLGAYLKADFSDELFGNYLRHHRAAQSCFQVRGNFHGVAHYLPAERVFAYEQGCSYRWTDSTRDKLLAEIEMEEFEEQPIRNRIVLNDLEQFIRERGLQLDNPADIQALVTAFSGDCFVRHEAMRRLIDFCHVTPRLPDAAAKRFARAQEPLGIEPGMERDAIEARLRAIRDRNRVADLAFYAFRDLASTEPAPFLKAAVERNPVSIAALRDIPDAALADTVRTLAAASIYDGPTRLAQPDEVWNYRRGDGLEQAILLANLWRGRRPGAPLRLTLAGREVRLQGDGLDERFDTVKELGPATWSIGG